MVVVRLKKSVAQTWKFLSHNKGEKFSELGKTFGQLASKLRQVRELCVVGPGDCPGMNDVIILQLHTGRKNTAGTLIGGNKATTHIGNQSTLFQYVDAYRSKMGRSLNTLLAFEF